MLVAELRRRLLERVGGAATAGDEGIAAVVMAHARAALVALAHYPDDSELVVQDLTVGTRTAALILGLHPEYVRYLIRRGRLQGTKQNGEFRIQLSDVADFAVAGMGSLSREAELFSHMGDILTGAKGGFTLWRRSQGGAESDE